MSRMPWLQPSWNGPRSFGAAGAPQDDVTLVLVAYEPVLSPQATGKPVSVNAQGIIGQLLSGKVWESP